MYTSRHIEDPRERKGAHFIMGFMFLSLAVAFSCSASEEKPCFRGIKNMIIENGIGEVGIEKQRVYFSRGLENEATDFIIKHEGFSSVPYNDLGGGKSIGYGQNAYGLKYITKKYAKKYVHDVVHKIQVNYSKHFEGLSFNEKVVLIDIIYNCHPANIGYIAKQMKLEDPEFRKQELVYALSTLQFAKGVKYGGLVKRFNARVGLLFN